jgi:hypothetical protein
MPLPPPLPRTQDPQEIAQRMAYIKRELDAYQQSKRA